MGDEDRESRYPAARASSRSINSLVQGACGRGSKNTNHLLVGTALWRHSARGLAAPQPFLFHYKSPTNWLEQGFTVDKSLRVFVTITCWNRMEKGFFTSKIAESWSSVWSWDISVRDWHNTYWSVLATMFFENEVTKRIGILQASSKHKQLLVPNIRPTCSSQPLVKT